MSDAVNQWIKDNAKKLIVGALVVGLLTVPALKLIGWVF